MPRNAEIRALFDRNDELPGQHPPQVESLVGREREVASLVYERGASTAALIVAAVATPDMLPLIITTGDNALHTAEMVRYFCDALDGVRERVRVHRITTLYLLTGYAQGLIVRPVSNRHGQRKELRKEWTK